MNTELMVQSEDFRQLIDKSRQFAFKALELNRTAKTTVNDKSGINNNDDYMIMEIQSRETGDSKSTTDWPNRNITIKKGNTTSVRVSKANLNSVSTEDVSYEQSQKPLMSIDRADTVSTSR